MAVPTASGTGLRLKIGQINLDHRKDPNCETQVDCEKLGIQLALVQEPLIKKLPNGHKLVGFRNNVKKIFTVEADQARAAIVILDPTVGVLALNSLSTKDIAVAEIGFGECRAIVALVYIPPNEAYEPVLQQ